MLYVEDIRHNEVLPLKLSLLVWIEDHLVKLMQLPVQHFYFFSTQMQVEYGACKIQKVTYAASHHVQLVVWPPAEGRSQIVIAAGSRNCGWLAFWGVVKVGWERNKKATKEMKIPRDKEFSRVQTNVRARPSFAEVLKGTNKKQFSVAHSRQFPGMDRVSTSIFREQGKKDSVTMGDLKHTRMSSKQYWVRNESDVLDMDWENAMVLSNYALMIAERLFLMLSKECSQKIATLIISSKTRPYFVLRVVDLHPQSGSIVNGIDLMSFL